MRYRRELRAILNTTDATGKLASIASDTLAISLITSDALYLGFHEKFASRYFVIGQVNAVTATLSVKYWDGDSWNVVEDLFDETNAFKNSGWITWRNVGSWTKKAQTPISDVELYWIKIETNTNLTAGTTLQAVLNLFCDATLLREYYPELVADTRYLPTGRSDFFEQLNAGKNLVVQELIKLSIIRDESQILDVSELGIATAHASAYCILNGIPNPTEETVDRKKKMLEDMNVWISRSRHSFDLDNSGEIDEAEKQVGTVFRAR